MKKDRSQGESKKPLVADPEAASEQEQVDAFCSSVRLDEISFESWCQHHSKLDLQFPLNIVRSQLDQVFKKTIRLSRSVKLNSEQGRIEKREKIEHEIVFHPGSVLPKVIVVQGLGDQVDERVGDLLIIIHIKD